MSDGSGVDFGVPRSKPFSEHGREEYDRIFGKKENEVDLSGKSEAYKIGYAIGLELGKEFANHPIETIHFDPQAHKQMR